MSKEQAAVVPNPLALGPEQDNRGVETQAVRPVSGVHQTPPVESTYVPGERKLSDGTVRVDY